MATTLPPATVKPSTAKRCSSLATTVPAAPFTSAGRENSSSLRYRSAWLDEPFEVALTRCSRKRLDHLALAAEVGIGLHPLGLDPAAGAARELARGRGRALDDRGDVVEGDGEHVVQHVGEALGGTQRLQDHEQSEADRVGEQRLVLRVALGARDQRIGHMHRKRFLALRLARAQHAQRHAGDHRGQPRAHVLDLARVGARCAQPGLLHGVVGLADRSEHAIGDGAQVGAVCLELGCQLVVCHISAPRRVSGVKAQTL